MLTQLVYYRYGVKFTCSYDSREEAILMGKQMFDEGSAYVESIVENGVKTSFYEFLKDSDVDN